MAKKTTLGRMYIDQLKADRAAQRVSIEMPSGLRSAIEEKLGRKLTDAEAIRGEVERVDKRPRAEQFADRDFIIRKKAEAPKTGAELLLEDAEKAAREEYLASLPRSRFRVEVAREIVQKEQADAIAAKAHADFLKSFEETSKRLDELKTDIRFDESWTFAEARQIDRAIEAIQTPGVDPAFALELAKGVFGVQQAKVKAIADALAARRAELDLQLAEIQGELDETPATEAPPEAKGFDYDAQIVQLTKLGAVVDAFSKLNPTEIPAQAGMEG
jgi:hypothetical protein